MTASVQSLETAAYFPPPPSASASNAQGAGGTRAASDTDDPSNFQSELDLQDTGTKDTGTKDTGTKKIDPKKIDPKDVGPASTKSGGRLEAGSDKTGKKRDSRSDGPIVSAMPPAPAAEPQKPILPVTLALPKPETETNNPDPTKDAEGQNETEAAIDPNRNLKTDSKAQSQDPASREQKQPRLLPENGLPADPKSGKLPWSHEMRKPADVRTPADSRKSPKVQSKSDPEPRVLSEAPVQLSNLESNPDAAPAVVIDGPSEVLDRASTLPVPAETVAAAPARASAPRVELNVPEPAPQEPAPVVSAMSEEADANSSSPAALAFAARMTAVPRNADEPNPANPEQPAGAGTPTLGSSTRVRVPVRYTPRPEILKPDADNAKKQPSAFGDKPLRVETRADMVLARPESARTEPQSFRTAASQYVPPSARMERAIETPAAAPASSRDIRVQVPDNNGGSTQVRFLETGGEVRVSVRTADASLAQNLRTHLNDLSARLADAGSPAEFWKPAAASSQNDHHEPSREGGGSGGHEPGGRQQPRDREEKRPAWLEEMEASLHAEQQG